MTRFIYTLERAWILLRMRLGGVRWYYHCGRAVLEIAGEVVLIEPSVSRKIIQALGDGPPRYES